jgi:hypothetical protein
MRIYCFLFLVLSGCATNSYYGGPNYKSPYRTATTEDLNLYLTKFIQEMHNRKIYLSNIKVTMGFGFNLVDYNALGQCNMKTKQVLINKAYWVNASDSEREALIFHELGHCILGRNHEDGTTPISGGLLYKSLMNTYGNILFSRPCYREGGWAHTGDCSNGISRWFDPENPDSDYNKYRDMYVDELFSVINQH